MLVKKSGEQLTLYLGRNSVIVRPLLECWNTAFEVFPGFVKDFVRVHVFPRLSDYVPSSARQGAEALRKLLQRNRELYRYEESETGKLESILGEYLSGHIAIGDVLKAAKVHSQAHTQRVTTEQVGRLEQEMPDVIDSPSSSEQVSEGRSMSLRRPS